MKRWGWAVMVVAFLTSIALQVLLAWDGDHFTLVTLAVTCVGLTFALGFYARGWRDALEGWGRSTLGWGAAQQWGMKQDEIMRDVLRELYEHDEEAAEIHGGRWNLAGIEYLMSFPEDVKDVSAELRKENV